jgi:WD40 repeat protein
VEVEVEGKRYRPPVVIRGLSAGWKEVRVYQGKGKFLTDVEILPGKVVDWTVTKEALPEISFVWVGKYNSNSWVMDVSFSRDGRLLASGGHDGTVRLWRVADGQCVWVGEHWAGLAAYSVSFSPDGCFLASGGGCGALKMESVFGKIVLRSGTWYGN